MNTGGAPYVEGNVYAGGDFVRGDKIVYTQSDAEQIDAYLQRAVTTLEARILRLVYRPDPPTEPYKFLDAFEIQDHPIFFGREDASDQLFAKVTAHRLTILHAKSGAGKSSLLQAGLGPRLVRKGRLPVYTRAYEDPVTAVKRAIASPAQGPWPTLLHKLTLHEFLGMAAKHLNTMQELVIMLDQFEAFFILGPTGEHRRPFIDDLANCIEDTSLPVRFVVALRKDYYSDLSAFQVRLPQIFHHEMALGSMTGAEAEAAITGPVAKLGRPVTYEPVLLEMLLADLTRGEVELPHLQIICIQLYEGLAAGEMIISLAAYEALDRAAGVLGGYLRQTLGQFKEEEREIAQAILVTLVSSEGTKRILDYETLTGQVKAERSNLHSLLTRLVDRRLVQRDEVEGALVYEIAHEYLVSEIQKWFDRETLAAKQTDELWAREVANWRVYGTLIPEERLVLLHQHRACLSLHSEDAVQCLIHSVVRAGHHLEDWIELVGKASENTLLDLLRGQDEANKGNAIEGLGILWQLSELKQLNSSQVSIREKAAKVLGKLGDVRAVEPLIVRLNFRFNYRDIDLRQLIAEALGRLGDVRAVEPLIACLDDNDAGVRRFAVEALDRLGDVRAFKPLIARLNDNDPYVQKLAAEVLGKWGESIAELLVTHLKDDAVQMRLGAAQALARLGDARALEPLIALLKHHKSRVRRLSAQTLGNLGDARAVEPLIAQLKDTDTDLRRLATEALGKLGDIRAVKPLIAQLKDADTAVRRLAAEGLGTLGDARAVEPLIVCLKNDECWVRRGAAEALGNLGDARAVEPLVTLLKDDDTDVRRLATEALGKLRDVHAVALLSALLKDNDYWVRQRALTALQRIATPEALAAISEYEANRQDPTT